MAILEEPYRHKTISFLTGVFGSVFDEIKIVRGDDKVILVPIAYQTKQRSTVRNNENPDPNSLRKKIILPRMGFKLTGLMKDPTRQLSKYHQLTQSGVDRKLVNGINSQYNRVPYNFMYRLDIKTKTLDDMLQIIEQILVYFNPAIRVTVNDNPDLNQDSAITIRLLDTAIDDIFEGSFENEQILEASLNFELEGWLYMPTSTSKVIKKVIVNYYDMASGDLLGTDIEVP